MVDKVSKAQRSEMMSKVKSKDTIPEKLVRLALFKRGFRYRIHYDKLPGKPDIVLPKYHAVIFINGCFWHGHDCKAGKLPSSNIEFWKDKIKGNKERDLRTTKNLNSNGFKVLTIWECALKGKNKKKFDVFINETENWILSRCDNHEIPTQ